jgi:hypothetical protein
MTKKYDITFFLGSTSVVFLNLPHRETLKNTTKQNKREKGDIAVLVNYFCKKVDISFGGFQLLDEKRLKTQENLHPPRRSQKHTQLPLFFWFFCSLFAFITRGLKSTGARTKRSTGAHQVLFVYTISISKRTAPTDNAFPPPREFVGFFFASQIQRILWITDGSFAVEEGYGGAQEAGGIRDRRGGRPKAHVHRRRNSDRLCTGDSSPNSWDRVLGCRACRESYHGRTLYDRGNNRIWRR